MCSTGSRKDEVSAVSTDGIAAEMLHTSAWREPRTRSSTELCDGASRDFGISASSGAAVEALLDELVLGERAGLPPIVAQTQSTSLSVIADVHHLHHNNPPSSDTATCCKTQRRHAASSPESVIIAAVIHHRLVARYACVIVIVGHRQHHRHQRDPDHVQPYASHTSVHAP